MPFCAAPLNSLRDGISRSLGAIVLRSDDHWLEISDLFGAAALSGDWAEALNGLADGCGGAHGQLIGVGPSPSIQFNLSPRLAADDLDEFVAIGGADPVTNPRVRMGLRLPVLEAWHEVDCLDAAEASPAYGDFCRRHDIPYGSQVNLAHDASGLVGLAVLRTRVQGAPEAADRRAFEALAPHVRAAVKLQQALEGRGAQLLAGAMEGLGRIAFVCDRHGLVQAMTPSAEQALHTGPLKLRRGRLGVANPAASHRLEVAIDRASQGATSPGQGPTVTLATPGDGIGAPTIIDVVALPAAPYALGFEPRVLVVVQGAGRSQSEIEQLLQSAYGLTAAEAHVAACLGNGDSPEGIAMARQVSAGTIRTQLRSIYQKLDVNRQLELAARLAAFR
ncbi:hypothetical protein E1H18_285 [Caulobacter sp. RHG1]|nr:hypothetical protein [Caulobacter sp. RHG1]